MTISSHNRHPCAIAFAVISAATLCGGSRTSAQVYEWLDISGSLGYSTIAELPGGAFMAASGDRLVKSTDGSLTWYDFSRPGGLIVEFTARGNMVVLGLFREGVVLSSQYWRSTDEGVTWHRFSAERPDASHRSLIIDGGGELHGMFIRSNRVVVDKFSHSDSMWRMVGNPSTALYVPGSPFLTVAGIDEGYNFYIGTGFDGIHSSRDGGLTWSEDLPWRYVSAITTDPAGDVAIGTRPNGRTAGGVFTTPDSGLSWDFIGLTDHDISAMGYDGFGRLYAVGSDGIYRHVGDESWEKVGPERDDYTCFLKTSSGQLMVSALDVGIGRSADSGETWFGDCVRGREIYSLACAPDGSLLAGTIGSDMYKSANGGQTWRAVETGIPSRVIQELDREGGSMIASTPDGVYLSIDDGESWSAVSTGQTFGVVTTFATDGEGDWYAGTPAGVYRSTDAGFTWDFSGLGADPIEHLTTGPDGSVYALSGTTGVYRWSPGGASWSSMHLDVNGLRTIEVSESGQIYAGGWSVVYRSSDDGATWDARDVASGYVEALAFNGRHHIVAGTTNGAFVSFTGGDVWDFAGLPGGVVTSFAFDEEHALVAGAYGGGVYRTSEVITDAPLDAEPPTEFRLYSNFPNPFNPTTTIRFDLPAAAGVEVSVYDIVGREVASIVRAELPAGEHQTVWDAAGRPAGVYFVRLRQVSADGHRRAGMTGGAATAGLVRKMLLLK